MIDIKDVKECARHEVCKDCKGYKVYDICVEENDCEIFKKEVKEVKKEWEKEE